MPWSAAERKENARRRAAAPPPEARAASHAPSGARSSDEAWADAVGRVGTIALRASASGKLQKSCGHEFCTLTMRLCCGCADKRPNPPGGGLFEEYVDGHGYQRTAAREKYYCPPCKDYATSLGGGGGGGGSGGGGGGSGEGSFRVVIDSTGTARIVSDWKCHLCTLTNSTESNLCGACGARRRRDSDGGVAAAGAAGAVPAPPPPMPLSRERSTSDPGAAVVAHIGVPVGPVALDAIALAAALSSALECSICVGVLNVPVTLACGHSFCRECIIGVPAVRGAVPCPLCRAPHLPRVINDALPSRALMAVLEVIARQPR